VTVIAPWPSDTRILQVGDLRLDLEHRRIEGGDEQELPQRIFDLLLLLIAEPNRLHTRAELFERLWSGLVVEDANLSQSVWLLRKALGESRKRWLRTVSKGGYIFEPPAPLQWFAELPALVQDEQAAAPQHPAPAPAPALIQAPSPAPQKQSLRLSPWRRWAVAVGACAALAIVIVIAVTTWQRRDTQSPPPPTQPVSVALMRVQDAGAPEQWPTWLLYEWLKWKLDSIPEVTLLSEADLAAGVGTPPQVVFLTSREAPDAAGKIAVMARFQHAGGEQRIEMEGTPEQIPGIVDALSQRVMQRLLPRRSDTWPKLDLDAAAAHQYAAAAQAFEHRDWTTVVATGTKVVQLAPRFGLMHLQLALAQSNMGQANSAVGEMDAARTLLQPAPQETRTLLEAQRLSMDPQHRQQATQAYAALTGRYPDKINYAIEYANLLERTGKPQQALVILQAQRSQPESIETRIEVLLGLAKTYQGLGDPDRMRESAMNAERLARSAGTGWERELAEALRVQGIANAQLNDRPAAIRLFEQTAAISERTGNKTSELHAQFFVQMLTAPGKTNYAKVEALLARANAEGDRRLEFNILLQLGWQDLQAGNYAQYRQRLVQAAAVAQASGDIEAQYHVAALRLNQQMLGMHMTDAQSLLQQLKTVPLEGDLAVEVALNEASLDIVSGKYDHGMETLERAAHSLPARQPGQAPSESQASIACLHVELVLPQGDLQAARKDVQECASAKSHDSPENVPVYRAAIALYSGDREEARNQLKQARERLESSGGNPDFWLNIEVARLLTRTGDIVESDKILTSMRTKLQPTGYDLLIALAETGLAENCAARADWACMRTHVAAARQGLPSEVWYVSSRLDLLDGAAALAAGKRESADATGQHLLAEARRRGDVVIQLQAYALLSSRSPDDHDSTEREVLSARTGMRGVTLEWLRLNALR
jgi:DNA-binding winged helix-turn-helix (wHTH) protein